MRRNRAFRITYTYGESDLREIINQLAKQTVLQHTGELANLDFYEKNPERVGEGGEYKRDSKMQR